MAFALFRFSVMPPAAVPSNLTAHLAPVSNRDLSCSVMQVAWALAATTWQGQRSCGYRW